MYKSLLRRGLSFALTLALALSVLPAAAQASQADGLCEHHPAHTTDCGYEESGTCTHTCSMDNGCITVACAHAHDLTCYNTEGKLNCPHACTENKACYTPVTNCLHLEHGDCGHSNGQACEFAVNGCAQCKAEEALIQIKGTDVTIEGYNFSYTGQEIRPAVTVIVNGAMLMENTHYTVAYANNVGVGEGSVTVTGIQENGYKGIVTIPFTIERPANMPEFTLVEIKGTDVTIDGTSFPYTGQAIEPTITVTVEGEVLVAGQDYSLTYENNIQPGTGSVTVKGIATASETVGYTGEVTIEFTITEAQDETPEESKPEESKPVEYKITKGNGKTWYQGSGKTLSFTIDGDADDFTGLRVDGKKVGSSYYTVKDNTTVTLKESFLNKLAVGKYTITVEFTDGEAEGSFRVSDEYDETNPATGDRIGVAVAVMLVSLAVLGGVFFVYRKRLIK